MKSIFGAKTMNTQYHWRSLTQFERWCCKRLLSLQSSILQSSAYTHLHLHTYALQLQLYIRSFQKEAVLLQLNQLCSDKSIFRFCNDKHFAGATEQLEAADVAWTLLMPSLGNSIEFGDTSRFHNSKLAARLAAAKSQEGVLSSQSWILVAEKLPFAFETSKEISRARVFTFIIGSKRTDRPLKLPPELG